MNNEPVAIVKKITIGGIDNFPIERFTELKEGTLLYTHPVNPKYDPETGEPLIDGYPLFSGLPHPVSLTDAELSEVYEEVYINYAGKDFPVDLGRAILRKAQEK